MVGGWVVIRMVWATLFFLGFCVVVFGGAVLLARGRSGTITGPLDREIDYENPYGFGGYMWTSSRLRQGPPPHDQVRRPAAGRRGRESVRDGLARRGAPSDPAQAAVPDRLPLDTGFRAAYYLVERYVLEHGPDEGLIMFLQYLSSDPARWDDWKQAVGHALQAVGTDDPLAENVDRRE